MRSANGMGGTVGAIVWIMINDVAGGLAGLAAGWMAMPAAEPVLGPLAGCLMLATVPLGLCAGAFAGVATLGWMAGISLAGPRSALSGG